MTDQPDPKPMPPRETLKVRYRLSAPYEDITAEEFKRELIETMERYHESQKKPE